MSKENRRDEAEDAINLASMIIMQLEQLNCKPEIAYAALGNAFTRMHLGLGRGKQEWMEITKQMGSHLKEDQA